MKPLIIPVAICTSCATAATVVTPSVKAEIRNEVVAVDLTMSVNAGPQYGTLKRGILEFALPDTSGEIVTSAVLDISLTGAARPFASNAVTELYIYGYTGDGVASMEDLIPGVVVAGPFAASWLYSSPNLPDLSAVDITDFIRVQAAQGSEYAGLRFELVAVTPYPLELRFSVGYHAGSAGTREPRLFIETVPIPEQRSFALLVMSSLGCIARRR